MDCGGQSLDLLEPVMEIQQPQDPPVLNVPGVAGDEVTLEEHGCGHQVVMGIVDVLIDCRHW